MALHSSTLAWRIPGTGEPGGAHKCHAAALCEHAGPGGSRASAVLQRWWDRCLVDAPSSEMRTAEELWRGRGDRTSKHTDRGLPGVAATSRTGSREPHG